MTLTFQPLAPFPEVVLITPEVRRDGRGWFAETFKSSEFFAHGLPTNFVQDNHSRSEAVGTVRGLHFQLPPAAQGKLVRCTRGRVFDVVVDVRRSSPTRGRHLSVDLDERRPSLLWVPPGFAHGFCVLEAPADLQYKATSEYNPAREKTLRWDDPDLAIPWPTRSPIVSEKDARAPALRKLVDVGDLL